MRQIGRSKQRVLFQLAPEQLSTLVPVFVGLSIVAIELAITFNATLLPQFHDSFESFGSRSQIERLLQYSISLMLFILGVSGIFYGAYSEAWGRRPFIVGGLFSFCLGTWANRFFPQSGVAFRGARAARFGSGSRLDCWKFDLKRSF